MSRQSTSTVLAATSAIVRQITGAYTIDEVAAELDARAIAYQRPTLAWALSKLAKQGVIRRLGIGWYVTNNQEAARCTTA